MNNKIKQLEIIESICGFVGGDEIKELIITKDTTNLTRTQISHFRTQLSFILEEPLLQRELISKIANTTYQQKSMPYLLRGICRTALHILRIQQTKKDLELLLFNQLETVLKQTDPPFYPNTWKTQFIPTQSTPGQPYGMPFQATKKYLHIPVQRPGISDEFVMLTEADKFSNGEHIYVLAESSRGNPRQQYCYFPKTEFISQQYTTVQPAEIRQKGISYAGFVTEKYEYHIPSSKVLTKLSDMIVTTNNNQSISRHQFGVHILTWYLILRMTQLHTNTQYISLDESFYMKALGLLNNRGKEEDLLIDGFIDMYGLPNHMIDFPAYCAERLSTHARAWKGTKEDVDHFTLDPNIHDIKSSQDHAALIASIKDILRIFCRQHYLTNKIVSSIQKIG